MITAFLFGSAGSFAFFKGGSCHPLYPDGKIGMPAPVRAKELRLMHGMETGCSALTDE
jgi:hypothetical protein